MKVWITSEHTPTPWEFGPAGPNMRNNYSQSFAIGTDQTLIAGLFEDVAGGNEVAKANAEFIALACNCHDDLVAALKYARRFLKPDDHDTAYVDAALAKAGVK